MRKPPRHPSRLKRSSPAPVSSHKVVSLLDQSTDLGLSKQLLQGGLRLQSILCQLQKTEASSIYSVCIVSCLSRRKDDSPQNDAGKSVRWFWMLCNSGRLRAVKHLYIELGPHQSPPSAPTAATKRAATSFSTIFHHGRVPEQGTAEQYLGRCGII